jgi:hypothetical protein
MSSDSKSSSDFKIDLPQNIDLPEDTVFYMDDICIPNSWYTIDEERNNKFYFKIGSTVYVKTIPAGNYSTTTFNAIIVALMNTVQGTFTANVNITSNTVGISTSIDSTNYQQIVDGKTVTYGQTFEILTDFQLGILGYPKPYQSINNYLNNEDAKVNTKASPYVSEYVNLNPIRNIYITSGNLGSYNTMSVSGERGIIKKVPVRANYNEMIYDDAVLGIDYLSCSRQSLSRLEFQLKDVFGNLINLHGNHWSFSLIFTKMKEE